MFGWFRRGEHRASWLSVRRAKARGVTGTGGWAVYTPATRTPDLGFLTRPPKLRQPQHSR